MQKILIYWGFRTKGFYEINDLEKNGFSQCKPEDQTLLGRMYISGEGKTDKECVNEAIKFIEKLASDIRPKPEYWFFPHYMYNMFNTILEELKHHKCETSDILHSGFGNKDDRTTFIEVALVKERDH